MIVAIAALGTTGDAVAAAVLASAMKKRGHDVILATEPFHANLATRLSLRHHPLSARRAQDLDEVIARALAGPRSIFERSRTIFESGFRPIGDVLLGALRELAATSDLLVLNNLALFPVSMPAEMFPARSRLAALICGNPERELLPWLDGQERLAVSLLAVSPAWLDDAARSLRKIRACGFLSLPEDESPLPPPLARFLENGEPPVLFSFGSFSGYDPELDPRNLCRAAERHGHRALILDPRPLDAAVPGEHLVWREHVPLSRVLARCGAIVMAGGIGTAGIAVRSGTPCVTVPVHSEQPNVGRRLVELGVSPGSLLPEDVSPDALGILVDEALNEETYRRAAKDLSRLVSTDPGVDGLCDALESAV